MNVHNTLTVFQGNRLLCTVPFTGERCTLVFFKCSSMKHIEADTPSTLTNLGFNPRGQAEREK